LRSGRAGLTLRARYTRLTLRPGYSPFALSSCRPCYIMRRTAEILRRTATLRLAFIRMAVEPIIVRH
jgi:lipoprotein